MASTLAWLDVSADQQRRVRDIIRLFEEPGTRDELGVGPIRDAFSELLFPGTSVIQTRARYFLFVPWHFQEAARRGLRGQDLLLRVDRSERQLIERFRKAGVVDGLIGRQAGSKVKILPSTIYWGGLERFGILTSSMTARAVAQIAGAVAADDDETSLRPTSAWHPTIPRAPKGFPNEHSGGFDLTGSEAAWLQERIVERAGGTLLAHLVCAPTLGESQSPWGDPEAWNAGSDVSSIVEHARRFSLALHGAALLYNLLVSEAYEARGLTAVDAPVAAYRDLLDQWAQDVESESRGWDWVDFWMVVARGNPRVPELARRFVEGWVGGVAEVGAANVAEDAGLRRMVENRVARLRGGRAVLGNSKLLGLWGGSSGASPLVYRWGTVRQLVVDIQQGLEHGGE